MMWLSDVLAGVFLGVAGTLLFLCAVAGTRADNAASLVRRRP